MPKDFKCGKSVKEHYTAIDELVDQDDELELPTGGIFVMPESLKGKSDYGLRKFLVIYFDTVEDYQTVLKALEVKGSKAHSHPEINTAKLVELCKR